MNKDDPARLCDPAMVSRFFDGELDSQTANMFRAHLDTCPACRQALKDHRIVSEYFQSTTSNQQSEMDFEPLEKNLLRQLRNPPIAWKSRFLELITARIFYIPATVLATALILFFTYFNPAGAPSEPSALITSFTGNVSSVMILETPKTHQTVLWFNEDPPQNGINHAL
jgi:anti-sigma factor RsiW